MKYTADGSFKLKRTLLPVVISVETSKIALAYPFGSKAVVFGLKKKSDEHSHSVAKLLVLTNEGK